MFKQSHKLLLGGRIGMQKEQGRTLLQFGEQRESHQGSTFSLYLSSRKLHEIFPWQFIRCTQSTLGAALCREGLDLV